MAEKRDASPRGDRTDDVRLRQLLKRAVNRETAPGELRIRIGAMIREASPELTGGRLSRL